MKCIHSSPTNTAYSTTCFMCILILVDLFNFLFIVVYLIFYVCVGVCNRMPVMDGITATKVLCEKYSPENRPKIVAMTANSTEVIFLSYQQQ